MSSKDFSIVETRIIQNMLAKKSSVDIAEILGKPVNDVIKKINEMCGIVSRKPFDQVQEEKREKEIEKRNKKAAAAKVKKINDEDRGLKMKRRKVDLVLKQQEMERKIRKEREAKPLFKNRQVDYSEMRAVRIDSKTIIYARPGEDVEELKKRFRSNKPAKSLTPENYGFKSGPKKSIGSWEAKEPKKATAAT